MNITTPNYNIYSNNIKQTSFKNNATNFTSLKSLKPLANDAIELSQKVITEKDYKKAQKYANLISKTPNFLLLKEKSLQNLNLKKLEGLQYGIPVFSGMSMKEIAFSIDSIHTVATLRSCDNACLHCYADARPNKKFENTEGLTNRMTFEDFKNLTDGITELKKRLGNIKINSSKKGNPRGEDIYKASSLFHDSDCINIYLIDKNGNQQTFNKLNKMLIDSTGQKGFFDTAGWNPNDKKAQDRAENIAAYFSNPDHNKEVEQFNISINAFNPWSVKAAELRKQGKEDAANRIEDMYAERMANVLTTFTPVLDKPYFGIISRALPDNTPNADGFKTKDLNRVRTKIYNKVIDKYNKNFSKNPSLKNNPEVVQYYTKAMDGLQKELFGRVDTSISPSGRFLDFAKKHSITVEKDESNQKTIDMLKNPNNKNKKEVANNLFKIIDANGDLYLTDYITDVGTDIHFNFESKNLKTPKMSNLDASIKFSKNDL